jgi:Nickel responsive protein SCO4226-like
MPHAGGGPPRGIGEPRPARDKAGEEGRSARAGRGPGTLDRLSEVALHFLKRARNGGPMPLYLDVHHKIEGLTGGAVGDAHEKDLKVQHKYGVNYLRYWYDEGTGKVFCLVEAPSKEAAEAVHREAHGLVADEIIEVKEGA